MFKPLLLLTAVAVAAAGPLAAQDAATPETDQPADAGVTAPAEDTADSAAPDAEAEAPGAESPSVSDLSMGTPAGQSADGPGAPYVREEFGDWALRCVRVEDGPEPCMLYQLLLDENDNPVAEIGLFPLPEGNEAIAGANFVAPMETFLPAGLRLRVDSGETLTYPFTVCSARGFSPLLSSGCLARIGFDQAMVNRFKRGSSATITILPAAAPDQEVVLNLSLSGFTAGFDAQGAVAPEAPADPAAAETPAADAPDAPQQ